MEGFYVCAIIFISGFGCAMGATVNMTLSNPSPAEGNNPVVMTCVYTTAANEEIRFVYIDSFKGQHYGYTNLVRHDMVTGATEWGDAGRELQDRAQFVKANGSMTFTLNSVTCDDTRRYKCDLTLNEDKHDKNYNMDIEALNVKDSKGETCGKAHSNVYNLSSLLCLFIASILLR